jgi:hypothetical protein
MNHKKIIYNKQKGFVLILVMLLVSSLTFLVVNIIMSTYTARNLLSTLKQKHDEQKLLACSIELAKALLSGAFDKQDENQSVSLESEEKLPESVESKDQSAQHSNNDDKKNNLALFKMYWNNAYQWKNYQLSHETEGVDGKVSLYVMCENGKIPCKKFIDMVREEQKKQNNKKEKGEELDGNKDQSAENIQEQKQEGEKDLSDDDKEKNIKKILEGTLFKGLNEWFLKMKEKSSALKSIGGLSAEENMKDPGQSNSSKSVIEEWLTEYEKRSKDKYQKPHSLWQFLPEKLRTKSLYGASIKIDKKNENGDREKYEIGDLCSVYNDNCNVFYTAPAVLEAMGAEGFQLTNEIRSEIIKAGTEAINKQSENSFEKIWTLLYAKPCKMQYPKEMLQNVDTDTIFSTSLTPRYFSVLCKIEYKNSNLLALVLFEKMVSFGKHKRDYAIKQIFLL